MMWAGVKMSYSRMERGSDDEIQAATTEEYCLEASPRPFLLRKAAMLIELVSHVVMVVEGRPSGLVACRLA